MLLPNKGKLYCIVMKNIKTRKTITPPTKSKGKILHQTCLVCPKEVSYK